MLFSEIRLPFIKGLSVLEADHDPGRLPTTALHPAKTLACFSEAVSVAASFLGPALHPLIWALLCARIASVPSAPVRTSSHANMEGAAAPSMRFAGVPLLPKSVSPRFQPVAPQQASALVLKQAPAPKQGAPAMSADDCASKLTSVPSLAGWSREKLQEQSAAAEALAGTAASPVNLVECETTAELPDAAAAAAMETGGAPGIALQQPAAVAGIEEGCGVPEESRQGASCVTDEGMVGLVDAPVQEATQEKPKEAASVFRVL